MIELKKNGSGKFRHFAALAGMVAGMSALQSTPVLASPHLLESAPNTRAGTGTANSLSPQPSSSQEAQIETPTMSGTYDRDEAVLTGYWLPPDGDALIKLSACDGDQNMICATLEKHAYTSLSQTDKLNPDFTLRERPLIGVHILRNVEAAGNQRWKGGALYDPRTGKQYTAKLKVLDDDHIKISGCIGPGLCKGYVWRRVAGDHPLMPAGLLSQDAPTALQTEQQPVASAHVMR